jgi:phosphatidylglycerophosphate synthase
MVSALREWMATLGKSNSVAVAFVGKLKTTFQMIAIPCLLYFQDFLMIPIFLIGTLLINIAALLTVLSMVFYLNQAIKTLKQ